MTTHEHHDIGAVAIGRNESKRLTACLRSLQEAAQFVVYVDSGSTDNSVAIARQLDVHVIELDESRAFTAARGRNAGALWLSENTSAKFVQFIDGDCELCPGWIEASAEFLRQNESVAVAAGLLRELDARRNVYHRLASMEWKRPGGEVDECGGISLMRLAAFTATGGFREELRAGEEPELCLRLRSDGWSIWRLDVDMALHDVEMSRFGQWWSRALRTGYGYAQGFTMHQGDSGTYKRKECLNAWIWGVIVPAVTLLLVLPTSGWSLVVFVVLYVVRFIRIARARHQQYRDIWSDSLLYAAFCSFAVLPIALGQVRFFVGWNR